MPGSGDDELGRTATAVGTPAATQASAPSLSATLGRYRIERVLGEGGMGVVHAAFDPDLERRVALKVLRTDAEAADARQRLLREARAMARLKHPNVVTVHEVGSANGRDYVAMELIEGETLADWLRDAKRSPDEIIVAFVAAGRGLAAAHAAGLVHRDFKPHNVLRGKDGRVCVTDFGLARGVEDVAAALATTLPVRGAAASSENTPSPLSGLTATGSVLGTPAYMAPEQWSGGTVGSAADQFAFCVALWEALTGARPFKGPTFEELKREVAAGARGLDASKLPRRLRAPLRRGLNPDPAKRWPSMDALLAVLAIAPQRRAMMWASVAAVVGASVVAALVSGLPSGSGSGSGSAPPCAASAIAVDSVWSAPRGAALAAAGRGDVRDAFDRDVTAWRAVREQACKQSADVRAPQLACLDGVLARIAAVGKAIEQVTGEVRVDAVLDNLVDPKACAVAEPPRFTVQPSASVAGAIALALEAARTDKPKPATVETFAQQPNLEPCASAMAELVLARVVDDKDVAKTRDAIGRAVNHAEICGDDLLRADAVVAQAEDDFEVPKPGPKARAATERAAGVVARLQLPDLVASVELLRARIAKSEKRWDDAFAAAERAFSALTLRGYKTSVVAALDSELSTYFARNQDGDMAKALAVIDKERPLVAHHDDDAMRSLNNAEGLARLFDGDLTKGHAEVVTNWKPLPHPEMPTRAVDGVVVDAKGAPVAGVTVAVGQALWIDSIGVLPFGPSSTMRMTTTDASGAFSFADAPTEGGVAAVAQHAVASGQISAHVKLVLVPTRRISGHVDLHGTSHSATFALASERATAVLFISPIARDGSYSIDDAPTLELKIGAAAWAWNGQTANYQTVKVPAGTAHIDQLALETPTGTRTLDVVIRSGVPTPLDVAEVFLLPGKHAVRTVADLRKLSIGGGQHAYAYPPNGDVPKPAAALAKPGDLVVHFTEVQAGELSACVIGLQGNFQDPKVRAAINSHAEELALYCATASATDDAVQVTAQPQKRFD